MLKWINSMRRKAKANPSIVIELDEATEEVFIKVNIPTPTVDDKERVAANFGFLMHVLTNGNLNGLIDNGITSADGDTKMRSMVVQAIQHWRAALADYNREPVIKPTSVFQRLIGDD